MKVAVNTNRPKNFHIRDRTVESVINFSPEEVSRILMSKESHRTLPSQLKNFQSLRSFQESFYGLIDDIILKDAESLRTHLQLLNEINFDLHMKTSQYLITTLRKIDPLKASIVSIIYNARNSGGTISYTLDVILSLEKDDIGKVEIVLAFLDKLIETKTFIDLPINVKDECLTKLVKITPRSYFPELYLKLFNLSIRTMPTGAPIKLLKETMMNGSEYERHLFQFGTEMALKDEIIDTTTNMTQRLLNFYEFRDLKNILIKFIKQNDQENCQKYLGLLLAKFEQKYSNADQALSSQKIKNDVQVFFNVLLYYCMTFDGYESSLAILNHLNASQVRFNREMLVTLIRNLRKRNKFEEILTLIHRSNLTSMTSQHKHYLNNELLQLLDSKYNSDSKILLGYFLSIYKDSFKILNELGLIRLVYDGQVGYYENESNLSRANLKSELVDDDLTNLSLQFLYRCIFKKLSNEKGLDSVLLKELYDKYLKVAQTSSISQNASDDNILRCFLYESSRLNDFQLSNYIFSEYLKLYPTSKISSKSFELIIYTHLISNVNGAEGMRWFNKMISFNLPITSSTIRAFVIHYHLVNDVEGGKPWAEELLRNNYKTSDSRVYEALKRMGYDDLSINKVYTPRDSDLDEIELEVEREAAKENEINDDYDDEKRRDYLIELNEILYENDKLNENITHTRLI